MRPTLFIEFQYGEEGFLGYFHIPDLAHTLLTFFLLFQQLPLTADITAITFGRNVFPEGADRFTRYDLRPDSRLDGDLELLAG